MEGIRFRNKQSHEETSVIGRNSHRGMWHLTLEDGSEIPESEFFSEWEQILPDFVVQDDFEQHVTSTQGTNSHDGFIMGANGVETHGGPNAMTEEDYLAEFQKEINEKEWQRKTLEPPDTQPPASARVINSRSPAPNPVEMLLHRASKEEYFFEMSLSVKVPKRGLLVTIKESFPNDIGIVVDTIMKSLDVDEFMDAMKSEIEKYVEANNNP